MSEEGVQVANAAVAHALQAVKDAEKEVAVWNEHVKSHLGNQEALAVVISERDKANERLKEANERLKEANERLKEAREYHLRLNQPLQTTKKQRIQAIDRPMLAKIIALAENLSLEESGKLVAVLKDIFRTHFVNGLFIRQDYINVVNIIAENFARDKNCRRVLVVGSPGIGKSVFGVLLCLLAIKEKKDVAYHPINGFPYYFTWNGTEYDFSDFPHPGIRYEGYFDGNDSGDALDNTSFHRAFLFSSPRSTNYNEFVKESCFKVYLNPWSKQECEMFAKMINFEEDEWLRRFNLVGGKPRFVFSSSQTYDILVKEVENAVPHNVDDLRDQVKLFGEKVYDNRMKHILFHFYRDEKAPSFAYLAYSSLAVEAMISARYKIGSADEIRSFLQTPAPNLQSWRGKEIEKFLLQDLASATFRIKSLEGSDLGEVGQLGPFIAKSRIIHAASEIQNELMLNIPLSKNFPAIDGVLVAPNDRLVIYAQSTVSVAHPIKFYLLKNVYKKLMQQKEFQGYKHILLFIVSNDIFDNFHFQPYKNADGKQDRRTRIDIKMKQYVGKVDSKL
jgi:DNA replication protein DnaC